MFARIALLAFLSFSSPSWAFGCPALQKLKALLGSGREAIRPAPSRRFVPESTPLDERVLPSYGYGYFPTGYGYGELSQAYHPVQEDVSVIVQVLGPDGQPLPHARVTVEGHGSNQTGPHGGTQVNTQLRANVYGYGAASETLNVEVKDRGYFPGQVSFGVLINGGSESEAFTVRLQPIASYVNAVSTRLLGQPPSPSELSHYEKIGQKTSPASVAQKMLGTLPGAAARVRLFAEASGLSLSDAEASQAATQLAHGRPERVVLGHLLRANGRPVSTLTSPDYQQHFVDLLYRQLAPTGRLPASEWRATLGALQRGNESSAIISVLTSPSFLSSANQ